LWKAYKIGEKITSKIFRHGLVPKLVSYIAAIMLVYASDVFIINALTMTVVSVDFMATKVIALVLISIEVKSMDESFVAVKGYSFIDKIKAIILKMKNVRKQF
jgi:sensor histidine kinase YesM